MNTISPMLINGRKSRLLKKLLKIVYYSKESSFYRNIWGDLNLKKSNDILSSIREIDAKDIIGQKFNNRLYIKSGLFVKIVYKDNIPFLVAHTKNSIDKENYGEIIYERPLVFFESSHESIERGLWLHHKNILPLMAEDNIVATAMIARRYQIDSIIGDSSSIEKIITLGLNDFDYKKIKKVIVVDSKFSKDFIISLKSFFRETKKEIFLSLPETGMLGSFCKESWDKTLVFHPIENTIIEKSENKYLVATRLIFLPTPIIKYKTDIKIEIEKKNCQCDSELSFLLQN